MTTRFRRPRHRRVPRRHLHPHRADRLGDAAAGGELGGVTAAGDLTVHGITLLVTIALEAQLIDDTVVVVGSLDIVFADYDVSVPSAPVVALRRGRGRARAATVLQAGRLTFRGVRVWRPQSLGGSPTRRRRRRRRPRRPTVAAGVPEHEPGDAPRRRRQRDGDEDEADDSDADTPHQPRPAGGGARRPGGEDRSKSSRQIVEPRALPGRRVACVVRCRRARQDVGERAVSRKAISTCTPGNTTLVPGGHLVALAATRRGRRRRRAAWRRGSAAGCSSSFAMASERY